MSWLFMPSIGICMFEWLARFLIRPACIVDSARKQADAMECVLQHWTLQSLTSQKQAQFHA
jgi:hypothetical protein